VTTSDTTLTSTEATAIVQEVLTQVGRAVVGKQKPLSLVLAAILAKGHVLIEDFPGLGKTLAARTFAQALGLLRPYRQLLRPQPDRAPAIPAPRTGEGDLLVAHGRPAPPARAELDHAAVVTREHAERTGGGRRGDVRRPRQHARDLLDLVAAGDVQRGRGALSFVQSAHAEVGGESRL
jgi:hypothetical protein